MPDGRSVDQTYDDVVQFLDSMLTTIHRCWSVARIQETRSKLMKQLHEDRRLMEEASRALSRALGQGLTDCYNDEDGETVRKDVLVLENLERRLSKTVMHDSVRKELKPHVW